MAKKIFTKVVRSVDFNTGEVLSEDSEFLSYSVGEPSYVKLYLNDIGRMNGLQPRTMAVLLELLKVVGYDNKIGVPYGLKVGLCEKLGVYAKDKSKVATNVIDQHLSRLVKAGLLYKEGLGLYVANPRVFGKGKWQDIKEIVMQVSYGKDGAVVMSEVKKSKLHN